MGKREFIALAAFLMAVNSLAIDIMLPALQQIGASLGVESENHRQFVVSTYLLGFGCAQLFYGPLSDRFGRRTPLLVGLVIYIVSAIGIVFVPTFVSLLMLRFIRASAQPQPASSLCPSFAISMAVSRWPRSCR